MVYHHQRGVPQIEVTFDIDANGIIKVSATDKEMENLTISLSKFFWINFWKNRKMKQDAEANAE
jgi:molecular chaperone DnaK